MTLTWDQASLERHNEAWKQAKKEMLGSSDADVPSNWFSTIAQRAEVIRKEMESK